MVRLSSASFRLRKVSMTLLSAAPLTVRLCGNGRSDPSARWIAALKITSWASLSLTAVGSVLDMTASIAVRRPHAGASTTQSPAQRPGEGDDGGSACHSTACMHALFDGEVQSLFTARSAAIISREVRNPGLSAPRIVSVGEILSGSDAASTAAPRGQAIYVFFHDRCLTNSSSRPGRPGAPATSLKHELRVTATHDLTTLATAPQRQGLGKGCSGPRDHSFGFLLAWLRRARPDVACLQELKATEAELPIAAVEKAGYGAVWRGQKSWNGVAILARDGEPVLTRTQLPGDSDDAQSRYIEAAINGVLIATLYAPNGNPQPGPKFKYKLAWMERLLMHAAELYALDAPVVLAGDFNVVPTDADIYPSNSRNLAALPVDRNDGQKGAAAEPSPPKANLG